MSTPADMQAYLLTLSPEVIDGSTDWPSVLRLVHDASNRLVIFTEDGGSEPEVPAASGIGDTAFMEPAVQVRVRGDALDGGEEAAEKAWEIYDLLHGIQDVTMGSTYYYRVRAQTPGPVFIGFDSKKRPEHTMSFRCARDA